MFKSERLTQTPQKNSGGTEPSRTRRWQPMDRFYLMLVCTGILVLVTALALNAPKEPRSGQADATILLNSGKR